MKSLLILVLVLTGFSSLAQKAFYNDYDWAATPKKYTVSAEDLTEDEVIVFEKKSIQILIDDETGLTQYRLTHHITLLNTDKAIEENNKFYVSGAADDIITQKARVIKPDGKIIELQQKDIQESKDAEGNVEYRYFALDGIEKGCYIEFLQFMEEEVDYSGAVMTLQNSTNKKEVELDLISPKHIEYLIYPINGMPQFAKDSSDFTLRRMFLNAKDVPGLEDEKWSAFDAQIQKCYFKIHRNTDNHQSNFYNYTSVTKNIHENMYTPSSKKGIKAMQKVIKEVCPDSKASLETKVRALENWAKTKISVVEFSFEGATDIELILERKLTNNTGLSKLMIQLLREMGITHEYVLTSDRTVNPFLEEFEGYNFLREELIYINELKMYLSPEFGSRLGFPPYDYTNTKGLFIKEVTVGDMTTAVGKVKFIEGTKSQQSIDQINVVVDFESDLSTCNVNLERITSGYKAQYPQVMFGYSSDEQKKTLREEYLKYMDEDAKLEDMKFENDTTSAYGEKPLVGRAKFNGDSFLEKAGDKMLLKAGLLIGPQAELYHQKERKLPVESRYTRRYQRRIEINIPEGYVVKNPQDLNFNVAPDEKDNSCGFVSTYKIEGNKIIVDITEWYDKSYYPVEMYLWYEKAMNAAADFNKVVLVLTKK